MINKYFVLRKIYSIRKYCITFVKWITIAFIVGATGGGVGALFSKAVIWVTGIRQANSWLIYLLPVGGLAIIGLYKLSKMSEDAGTNLIISSIRTSIDVPMVMAPLIFVSTVITHLLGGSAGREGAALQLGGSIGAKIGSLLKLDERDMSLVIMCGMSAVFSALFGTPLTAAFFAMEVISVGVIYYAGLVPCIASALVAFEISTFFGNKPEAFEISEYIPKLAPVSLLQTAVLAAGCALVSIIFCMAMKYTHEILRLTFENSFIRAVVGGCAVIFLTLIIGNQDYNGSGMDVITNAVENGTAHWYSFLLKIVFTAITIGAGFKGGEIVPTLFIGSTFGCVAGGLLGMSPQFGASLGIIALFCGVVNCPVASIFLSIEMFGVQGLLFFAFASGISYMLSGYYGLYSSQKIVYSKLKTKYVNKNVK
ncbi:MAG: chloride channel protein [Ruminococcus sp.]|nr:chloride channel protein [Ruminococcus sp.]